MAIFFGLVFLASVSSAEEATAIDPETGLNIKPGWELVKSNCTACHSAKLIVMQRGDRGSWLEMIRWMQKTQGLWSLDSKTETAILDYLAENYPPGHRGRRLNLPARDLPPNPWAVRIPKSAS